MIDRGNLFANISGQKQMIDCPVNHSLSRPVTAGQGPVLNFYFPPRESSEAWRGESYKMLQGLARTKPLCIDIA